MNSSLLISMLADRMSRQGLNFYFIWREFLRSKATERALTREYFPHELHCCITNYVLALGILISSLSLVNSLCLPLLRYYYLQSLLTFHILTQNHITIFYCNFLVSILRLFMSRSVHFCKSLPFYFHYAHHRHLQSSVSRWG